MQETKTNAQRREETTARLLTAARALFVENGYADTGTPAIVAKAGVTRGALYHHFSDKQALFKAVVEAESNAVRDDIDRKTAKAKTPTDALILGAEVYMQAMREPGRLRLLLIDGPAVLGVTEMRAIDEAGAGHSLAEGLIELLPDSVPAQRIECLADLLSAMFDRAALAVAEGGDEQEYRQCLRAIIEDVCRWEN